jgi:YVTN family beta-propeller protein
MYIIVILKQIGTQVLNLKLKTTQLAETVGWFSTSNKLWKLLVLILITVFTFSATYTVHANSTVTLGGSPWGAAYDSAKGEIFVVNSAAGNVLVLSDSNYAVLATVNVGQQPYRCVYDSGKGEIFVANYGSNSVSIISDQTNTVVATIPVGISPASFAYDSSKGEVFVANSGDNTVSIISDSTNSVVATITVGSTPYDLAYDSATGEVYVANSYSRSVSVISDISNQVVATISVGSGPLGVAYDYAKGEIFVANSVSDTVSVISDSNKAVIATVTVGASPGPMVYNPNKGEVFAVNRNSGSISVISDISNTVVATLPVGNKPYGAVYNSARGEIIVTNYGDGTLSIVSDTSAPPAGDTGDSSILLQQLWAPKPANAVVAVVVTVTVTSAASLIFATISNPLSNLGGNLSDKLREIIPDNVKQWLEEIVSSKTEVDIEEKTGSILVPTKLEILAYITSIVVLTFAFSYVKVDELSQIWQLLPIFLITSILVGFVQKFFSIVYLRSRGVWSEHTIWPLGFILFLSTTLFFRVPFSSPTRSLYSKKYTNKLGAITASAEILISLAFAGLFFILLRRGYVAIGDAGLSMCVIGSFFSTFPISPMSGKNLFDYNKRLWATLFVVTLVIFVNWLLIF